MNKKVFFVFFLLAAGGFISTMAQDTVRYGDSVYMFNSNNNHVALCEWAFNHHFPYGSFSTFPVHESISQAYHTDSAIMVYGVAVCFGNAGIPVAPYLPPRHDSINSEMNDIIDMLRKDGCMLTTLHQGNMETGSISLVDTAIWEYPMPQRLMEYSARNVINNCGANIPQGDTVQTYSRAVEFYFDHPHQVHDTFYVGILDRINPDPKNECFHGRVHNESQRYSIAARYAAGYEITRMTKWIYFPNAGDYTTFQRGFPPYLEYLFTSSYLTYLTEDNSEFDSTITDVGIWGLVFPILYPRMDGCKAPAKPWFVDRTDASATFEWEQAHDVVEVVVNRDYNGMPDTMPGAVTIPAGSTGYTATGLEPNTYYGIWVRRQCHWITPTFDTVVWSPWTHVQLFNTAPEGIDPRLDPTPFEVSPNPAHASFRVTSNAVSARLALFDIRGTELYATDLHAQSVNIGVADLPAGVYFVTLTSTSGTSTRRLVLQ